jgi:hypothetical protein
MNILHRIVLFTLFFSIIFCSCKRDNSNNPPEPPLMQGTVRDKGIPDGPKVTKIIGATGGTIATADKKITLTVPPGAVAAATEFSIQPITNTIPGARGQSFRLLPEGQTFTKPIELTFKYDSTHTDSTSSQLLFIAYQAKDNTWKCLAQTELDETNQTLKITTTHFSDWGIFAEFDMGFKPNEVMVKQQSKIFLEGPAFYYDNISTNNEYTLAENATLKDPNNFRNWSVYQAGTLQPSADRQSAIYTAPDTVPKVNPVQISVEIYNFIPPKSRPRKGAKGKAIILGNLKILENTYFKGSADGVPFDMINPFFLEGSNNFYLSGGMPDSALFGIFIYPKGNVKGTYSWRTDQAPGSAHAAYAKAYRDGNGFENGYTTCDKEKVLSSGKINVEEEIKDNVRYLVGSFDVILYGVKGYCPDQVITKINIRGKFRLKSL